MMKIIFPRCLLLTFVLVISSVWSWGQTEVSFDISKGNVKFTDATYTGYNSAGTMLSGEHNPENHYIISGTTTAYNIQVGTAEQMLTKNLIIYLNGVDIQRKAKSTCAFSVYNKSQSVVAVILKDKSKNILYSGLNRAGLEKSGGTACNGTLLITCENGYTAWTGNSEHGHTQGEHNESACTADCGSLDAKSGNAWTTVSGSTYYQAGAGIGTSGKGTEGSTIEGKIGGTNALVNLTIAGGHIEAAGTWGNTGGSSGGGASIGTGSANMSNIIGGTVSGLKITGGNIKAWRIDNSAACIGGGYRSGYVTMEIYGGTINAKEILERNSTQKPVQMRAAAVGGGGGGNSSSSPAGATVRIYNGKIDALGQYGSAIGSGAGGSTGAGQNAKVIIENGLINAETDKGNGQGSGAAIGSGGSTGTGRAGNADIIIKGGIITAKSELGADIGGGGTNSDNKTGNGGVGNVDISGGTITVTDGGIGGGRANAGVGGNSTITISGDNTTITANSIGGGRSSQNTGGDVTLTVNGGKLTVADFIGGGVGGTDNDKIGCATVNIHGGDISGRILMRASKDKGCIFNMTNGKLTSPKTTEPGGAVYIIDPNGVATMNGGTIYNCKGTTGGAVYMSGGKFDISGGTISNCIGTVGGGAVYMEGGEFTISNTAVMQNNNAVNGGAVYLAGTGKFNVEGGAIAGNDATVVTGNGGAIYMNAGEFAMTSGTISNYKRTYGGAVYMAGGDFDISGGTISECEGTTGGAVYLNNGNFTISGSAEVHNNIASNGGAVYLDGTGNIQVSGGTIHNNTVTQNGGAIYLNKGTFTMNEGEVKTNSSTAGNGAGIYIANGTVTVSGGEVSWNNAEAGKGGGFYVGGGNVKLSNGLIASNKAKLAGGGICLENANVEVNGCTLTENEATAGNGGGLFLYNNASMTYNGGILTFNKATGITSHKTAYGNNGGDIQGVGGGIYISDNSTLTFGDFSKLGIYANTADMAADDILVNGNNTTLVLPNVSKMSLDSYAGNAEGLGWYEDYFEGDEKYIENNVAKGSYDSFEYRFRTAQEIGREFMREYEYGSTDETKTFTGTYVAFALGFLFSDLIIEVEGLKPGESCIFNVQGTADGGKYQYQVPMHGSNATSVQQRITKLPVDLYTVTLLKNWSWAYGDVSPIKKVNSSIYKFTLQHTPTPVSHDEEHVKVKLK